MSEARDEMTADDWLLLLRRVNPGPDLAVFSYELARLAAALPIPADPNPFPRMRLWKRGAS